MNQPISDHPATYTEGDFATSTDRVRSARKKLLENRSAATAHRELGEEIARRVEGKRSTLAEVRRAVGLTQQQLAETLGMQQGDISKLEHRHNLHLTTLTRFIEATGGKLRITAIYGDTEVALDIDQVVPDEAAQHASTTGDLSTRY